MDASSIARRSGIPSVVTDDRSRIVFWNAAASALFGRARRPVEGRKFPEVVGGRDIFGNQLRHEEDRFRGLIESGEAIRSFAFDVEAAGGRRQRVAATVVVVLGPGEEINLVYQLRPVEARRKSDLVMDAVDRRLARGREGASSADFDRPTVRQLEILRLIAEGKTAAEISGELGISRNTARNHTQHLLERLGVHSKSEAVAVGIRRRMI